MTVTRGTTNGNARGSSYARAARRAYLLQEYAADVHVLRVTWPGATDATYVFPRTLADETAWMEAGALNADLLQPETIEQLPAARCYCCGKLLTDMGDDGQDPNHLTVDRIVPGFQGGTYRRTNIRPACAAHNSELGAKARHQARKGAKRPRRPEPQRGGTTRQRASRTAPDRAPAVRTG